MENSIGIRHMNDYRVIHRPGKFVVWIGRPRFIEDYLKIRAIAEMISEFDDAAQVNLDLTVGFEGLDVYYRPACNDGITLAAHSHTRFQDKLPVDLPGDHALAWI